MSRKPFGLLVLMALVTAVVAVIVWPGPASAQCGSAASSCKDCHEVKKAHPVNAKGTWHTAHAFGDFCAFCHSGNTKSKDENVAHTGLIDLMADVKGSCQSCHPNDYMDRAKKYADALGRTVGTSGTSASTAAASGTTTTASVSNCGPAAPTGGQTIDLNKVYAGLDQKQPNVMGNAILIGLIAALALVLAGLIFYYEKPLSRSIVAFRQLLATPVLVPEPVGGASVTGRPELGTLLPMLSNSDAGTLRALQTLLLNQENGPKILKALGHLDLDALAELSEGDQKALASLLTLAKEMKS